MAIASERPVVLAMRSSTPIVLSCASSALHRLVTAYLYGLSVTWESVGSPSVMPPASAVIVPATEVSAVTRGRTSGAPSDRLSRPTTLGLSIGV
jgi:hypothetical protein